MEGINSTPPHPALSDFSELPSPIDLCQLFNPFPESLPILFINNQVDFADFSDLLNMKEEEDAIASSAVQHVEGADHQQEDGEDQLQIDGDRREAMQRVAGSVQEVVVVVNSRRKRSSTPNTDVDVEGMILPKRGNYFSFPLSIKLHK